MTKIRNNYQSGVKNYYSSFACRFFLEDNLKSQITNLTLTEPRAVYRKPLYTNANNRPGIRFQNCRNGISCKNGISWNSLKKLYCIVFITIYAYFCTVS